MNIVQNNRQCNNTRGFTQMQLTVLIFFAMVVWALKMLTPHDTKINVMDHDDIISTSTLTHEN